MQIKRLRPFPDERRVVWHCRFRNCYQQQQKNNLSEGGYYIMLKLVAPLQYQLYSIVLYRACFKYGVAFET